MASTRLLLLQLLLVSLASASHYFGGTATFTYKGRNPDGTFRVDIRNRDTFDGCYFSHYWYCFNGNCGTNSRTQRGVLDRSTNAPRYNGQWCETETVSTRNVPSDKPFQLRAYSCCWIQRRDLGNYWTLLTSVDLGSRSDTGEPNRSPDIAILPFLRVPQNCPRTYKLMSFDPDGDKVRCRYGNIRYVECGSCNQPSGFVLDQGSCTLHYNFSYADPRVYGFELVVEDFPQRHITLAYTDGSQSSRAPLNVRRKRQAPTTTTGPTTTRTWWWWQTGSTTAAPSTTTGPTTTPTWWWWQSGSTTAAPSTTTGPTTTPTWWWWQSGSTTAAPSTTTGPTTTPTWWWWQTGSTTAAPFTTTGPTTTRTWWWWQTGSTTSAPSTTTGPTTTRTTPWSTTTAATTTHITTVPYRYTTTTSTAPSTTADPTTRITTVPYRYTTTTTAAPTTTTAPTTTAATTTRITTIPHWHTTTTPTTTTPPYTGTTPLSKLPLQFSFLVDPPAPSCQEGHYLPKFVHPTPENGERLVAEVDKELEIRVKAQAAYATIHDIIISGPLNISKHRTTHGEFVIRWTPIADDQGDHYPICFAVEAVSGSAGTTVHTTTNHHSHHHPTPSSQSGIYQSEMRCVLVKVQNNHVNSHVICNESSMTVAVEKSSFPGLHEDHLQLSDPSNIACSFQEHSNSTHVIAVVPLNACGTQIEEDDDNLMFKNVITTVDNITDLITRKHLLKLQFECQYPKRGNVTQSFTAHRANICVWEKGFGRFTYQFEFYPDRNFQTMRDPNSYPLEYDIGNRIYMQIEATTSVNNTELFVESCTAAPYDNPNYRPTYSIIDNGCNVDSTVEVYSSANKTQFRFSIEAFKFIGLHDQVYISCSVLMCEAGSHGTRCSKGCMSSSPWGGGHSHHRRKREAVTQSSRHFISQGPLRLRRSAERTGSPVINLNLNLVFIAGCLLAAVGMISAVAIYKTKVSKVKYQPLTTYES